MRMMFGLVAVLVGVGVMMYAFTKTEIPVAKRGEEARQQAEQISGRDTDGKPIGQTFKLVPEEKNGQLQSMLVQQIDAGGAMQQFYGLQPGDQILRVGAMDMQLMNNDSGTAQALIEEAYGKQEPLIVLRGTQRLTLPDKSAPPATPSAAEQQLSNVKIPTH